MHSLRPRPAGVRHIDVYRQYLSGPGVQDPSWPAEVRRPCLLSNST
jgi:hypothetical protein